VIKISIIKINRNINNNYIKQIINFHIYKIKLVLIEMNLILIEALMLKNNKNKIKNNKKLKINSSKKNNKIYKIIKDGIFKIYLKNKIPLLIICKNSDYFIKIFKILYVFNNIILKNLLM